MRVIGEQGKLPVGCFFLIRRDLLPRRVPALTLHRVTRRDADLGARLLSKSAGFAQGYDVVGLDSECDCMGRAVLEQPGAADAERDIKPTLCPCGIIVGACPIHGRLGIE